MPEVELYPGETQTEDIENLSLVRLRLITHNARLVDTRKERGMTQLDMVLASNIKHTRLSQIETLKVIPTEDEIANIACVLEKPIDYLFPEELLSAIKIGVFSRRKVELAAPEIISLTEAQRLTLFYDGETRLIEEVSRTMLAEKINEVLEALAPREQRVLRLRFGFNSNPMSLKEVGREFNVTRERIRQIECKALHKLRHPRNSRKLKGYLD